MKKKLLLILLGVLMALPSFARDFQYTYQGQTLTYTVVDEEAKTVRTKAGSYSNGTATPGNTVSGLLNLPAKVYDDGDSYTLVAIGSNGFATTAITGIIIPSSVETIGSYAFQDCSNLTGDVIIPPTVKTMERGAFQRDAIRVAYPYTITDGGAHTYAVLIGYDPATSVFEDECLIDQLTGTLKMASSAISGEFFIPSSVTSIGESAFRGCSGLTEVIIPNSVTSIGSRAFYGCSGLTKVIIPNSVTSISEYAFYGCSGLTEVIIPSSVTSIGGSAFNGCNGLKKSAYPNTLNNPFSNGICISYNPEGAIIEGHWIYGPDKSEIRFAPYTLEGEYTIPETVTSIGAQAFTGCSGLTEVIIPNSVTSIGAQAFTGCSGLTEVTIGNSVETIGESAFEGCSGLTEVIIPSSVTSIGGSAFNGCNGLKKLAYPNTLKNPFSYGISIAYNPEGAIIEGHWIYGPDKSEIRFAPYTLEGEYTIPETVTSIGESAFEGCSGLTKVIIPNSVTSIGGSAFYGCSGLTKVIIPNSVTSISEYAFYGCSGLTEVIIPNSVTSIGGYAFYGCRGLTEVIIGNSVTSIGESAFRGCSGLKKSAYPNTLYYPFSYGISIAYNPEGAIIEGHWIYGPDKSEIRFAPYTLEGEYTIPETVTSIGEYAFYGCSGLTEVIIPNSVTSIGGYAFYGCSGLTEVIIPNSVKSIGSSAFDGCSGLKKSAYPNTLNNPFRNGICISYNPESAIIEGHWIYGPDKSEIRFAPYTLGGEYTIPETVTSIGRYAFYGCSGLTEVIIPNSVTSIGGQAFYGCSGLTKVNSLPVVPPVMNDDSFSGLYNSVNLEVPETAVLDYMATNWSLFKNIYREGSDAATTVYNDGVLNYCLIPASGSEDRNVATVVSGNYSGKITIPERFTLDGTTERYYVEGIGYKAFANSTISDLSFNSRIELKSIGDYSFSGCSKLTSLVVPSTVKSIGESAFNKCTDLTAVTLNDGLELIGTSAFAGCSKLTSLVVPSTVKSIGESAFSYCSGLTTVTLNEGLESIGASAFSGCSKLSSLIVPSTVKNIGEWAFNKCTDLTAVTLNDGLESIGASAFSGCSKLSSLIVPSTVQSIGESAFSYCSGLTRVTLNEGLESIGASAFSGCSLLSSIAVPSSVQSIDKSTFNNCSGLTTVTLNEGLESIGASAFERCTLLSSIAVPSTVQSIGASAFYNCSGLKEIKLLDSESLIDWGNEVFYGVNSLETLYIGRPLESQVFPVSKLRTLVIGNNVKEIGASVWTNVSNLNSLSLGSSLTKIGDNAFSGCTGLKEVIFPPAVETIGASSFEGNTSLASIIMGHKVKTIGEKAFDGCPASTVSITAQTPPTAPNNTFSVYTGKLYLQGQNAVDAYYDAFTCWDRFDGYELIVATEMKSDGLKNINSGKTGDTFQLTATLMPKNVSLPQIFWRSTNPDIATVDANGLVTLHTDLDEVMVMSESEGYDSNDCKIIAESLYADGPIIEFMVAKSPILSGLDEIVTDNQPMDNFIDFDEEYEVYNFSGILLGNSIKNLEHGFYIVRQGTAVKKIAVE